MVSVNGVSAIRGILYRNIQQVSENANEGETIEIPLRFDVPDPDSAPTLTGVPDVAEVSESNATSSLAFGVFDPDDVFAKDRALQLRHVYVSWVQFDEQALTTKLQALEKRGHQVFLTIEPWPLQDDTRESLLLSIVAGKYDAVLERLCGVLSSLDGPVYLSWGHEMDQDLTNRYPWSAANPSSFVEAYKYVVDRVRSRVKTKLNWVWAGVLKDGSLRYWPGPEYADFVGMPIYCFSNWDQKNHGYIRDFSTDFEEKLKVIEPLEMPVIITEMGVSGSPDFESFWLHQAFKHFDDYPSLKAVLFFYARDIDGAWGKDIATPDWRVHPDSIRGLVDWNTSIQRVSHRTKESRASVSAKQSSLNHVQN